MSALETCHRPDQLALGDVSPGLRPFGSRVPQGLT